MFYYRFLYKNLKLIQVYWSQIQQIMDIGNNLTQNPEGFVVQ